MSAQKLILHKLEIEHALVDNSIHQYHLHGHLSHTFSYQQLPPPLSKKILFNLKGISLVSSVGVREWVILLNSLSQNHKIYYEECSICFIDQINMVPDCLGSATIISFYAPFYCDHCQKEKYCLIDLKTHLDTLKQHQAPCFQCDCGKCQKNLDFDALEESYFSFIHFS